MSLPSYSDDFDSGVETLALSAKWTASLGTWSANADGRAQSDTLGAADIQGMLLYGKAEGLSFSSVDLSVYIANAGSVGTPTPCGLVWRMSDEAGGWDGYGTSFSKTTNTITLKRFDNGIQAGLGNATVASNLSSPHTLRVRAIEHIIEVYLNGSLVLAAHDPTYASGYCGLRADTTAGAEFDSFEIRGVRRGNFGVSLALPSMIE